MVIEEDESLIEQSSVMMSRKSQYKLLSSTVSHATGTQNRRKFVYLDQSDRGQITTFSRSMENAEIDSDESIDAEEDDESELLMFNED